MYFTPLTRTLEMLMFPTCKKDEENKACLYTVKPAVRKDTSIIKLQRTKTMKVYK